MRATWLIRILVLFLASMDLAALALSLPHMAALFALPLGYVALLPAIFGVGFAAALPLAWALQPRLGVRAALLLGAMVCVGSAAATAWATSFAALLVARLGQAAGYALLWSAGLGPMGEESPPAAAELALGLGLGWGAGALLAAQLLTMGGWRLPFLAEVPFALAIAVLAAAARVGTGREQSAPPVDGFGAVLLLLVPAALLAGLDFLRQGRTALGFSSVLFGSLAVVPFWFWEAGIGAPAITSWRRPSLSAGYVAAVSLGVCAATILVLPLGGGAGGGTTATQQLLAAGAAGLMGALFAGDVLRARLAGPLRQALGFVLLMAAAGLLHRLPPVYEWAAVLMAGVGLGLVLAGGLQLMQEDPLGDGIGRRFAIFCGLGFALGATLGGVLLPAAGSLFWVLGTAAAAGLLASASQVYARRRELAAPQLRR